MGALKCDSDEEYCNGQVPFIWTNALPSDDFTPAHSGNKPSSSCNNQALGNHIDRDLRVWKFARIHSQSSVYPIMRRNPLMYR